MHVQRRAVACLAPEKEALPAREACLVAAAEGAARAHLEGAEAAARAQLEAQAGALAGRALAASSEV